jgi:hypothetical protein
MSSERPYLTPALAGVRVEGMTRGAFILRGALAAGAVYGASTVGPFVRQALAQSDATDTAILDFALGLENLEAAFYEEALKQVPGMSREVKVISKILRDDEREHRQILGDTIRQLGVIPSVPQNFDFGDAFSSEGRYLEVAQTLEETGVSAYNGAGPQVFTRRILQVAGAIVQVEARHAAVIRDLRGEPITGGALDKPLTEAQVADRVRPFIAK